MTPLEFIQKILPPNEGFLHLATKDETGNFENHWLRWPANEKRFNAFIEKYSGIDCYYSPSIFGRTHPGRSSVQSSSVCFADFDGPLPSNWGDFGEPSLILESSPGKHHVYWSLPNPREPGYIESINKRIAQELGADLSGWDAGQLLRIPETTNLKTNSKTRIISERGGFLQEVTELAPKLTTKEEPNLGFPTFRQPLLRYTKTAQVKVGTALEHWLELLSHFKKLDGAKILSF